jgi:RNA polymerase sigma-70 factor (ECF subfamily)
LKFIKQKQVGLSDAELVAEYKQTQNLEVLGKLYQKYMPLVFGLCLKYFKEEERSKDAVMQIFEQLIQKLKYHEVGNFKNWLYSLSRNFCLMELRFDSKHETVRLEDNPEEPESRGEIDFENEDKLASMESCIQKLPDEQRMSIDLFYLQQKCYKEVADITGFDINKVKSYIQNGKRNLKICMERNRGNE